MKKASEGIMQLGEYSLMLFVAKQWKVVVIHYKYFFKHLIFLEKCINIRIKYHAKLSKFLLNFNASVLLDRKYYLANGFFLRFRPIDFSKNRMYETNYDVMKPNREKMEILHVDFDSFFLSFIILRKMKFLKFFANSDKNQ